MNLSGKRLSRNVVATLCGVIIVPLVIWAAYILWFAPTRILVVNALPARQSEMKLNNDLNSVDLVFAKPQDLRNFSGYEAIIMFGRNLYLDSIQLENCLL